MGVELATLARKFGPSIGLRVRGLIPCLDWLCNPKGKAKTFPALTTNRCHKGSKFQLCGLLSNVGERHRVYRTSGNVNDEGPPMSGFMLVAVHG
jgi:hypothetical protein